MPLHPTAELPDETQALRLRLRNGTLRDAKLLHARPAGDAWLVTLEGVRDRDTAERLIGATVYVPIDALPQPTPYEAYVFELEGAHVVDEAGKSIGIVRAVLAGIAQDLLAIDTAKGEGLLPMVPGEFIMGFDRDRRTLTVRVPDGLWD